MDDARVDRYVHGVVGVGHDVGVDAGAWGESSGGCDEQWGKLGIGSGGNQAALVQTSRVFPSPVVDVQAGVGHAVALLADGTVWTCGSNQQGQLGDGTTTDRSVWAMVPGLTGIKGVGVTAYSSFAIDPAGAVWAWGDGRSGRLGNPDSSKWGNQPTPAKIAGLSGVVQITSSSGNVIVATYALRSDGTVWAWGKNDRFARGDLNSAVTGTPAQIAGLSGITQLAGGGGYGGLALKQDGTVWVWGSNVSGQLCDGTTADNATPRAIPGLTGVVQISAVSASTYETGSGVALKSDKTVWTWGENSDGQLGDGTKVDKSAPVQVLAGVAQISGSIQSTFALMNDGRLAGWGATGLSAIGSVSSPGYITPARPVKTLRTASKHAYNTGAVYLIIDPTDRV